MGKLIDGIWHVSSLVDHEVMGGFERLPRTFLSTISPKHPVYRPDANRYHLYVNYTCPWATRAYISAAQGT